MDQAASNARDEESVVNLELNSVLQRLPGCGQHLIELLCLRDGARESVQNEAVDEKPMLAR